MRNKLIPLIVVMFALLASCQPKVIYKYNYYSVPVLAPGVSPEMNTAGFWIGLHPDPDALIMAEDEIADFNEYIIKKTKAVRDIRKLSATRDGRSLSGSLKQMLDQNKGYVDSRGEKMSKEYISGMDALMGADKLLKTIAAQWAFVVSPADQRLLPITKPLYKSATDTGIDRLQNNALDVATPVLVLTESTDHKWFYVISPNSEGWLLSEKVAFCTKEEMDWYEEYGPKAVAVEAKVDLFADPWLRQHLAYMQMGCVLPLLGMCDNSSIQVLVPVRKDDGWCAFIPAYTSAADMNQGYLPYTPRTALVQAFKLLNAPYGWGGMHGEQDCSRFVQEVFATMGIVLPRNSSQQGRVGRLISSFNAADKQSERQAMLAKSAMGGITTLQFPGHIMLYLGSIGGRPYAIHDLYAYAEPASEDERLVPMNRVVVSSLALGEGTKKGPFIMRLGNVREVSPEPSAE